MKKHNPVNERIKREYLRYLQESDGQSESSVDAVAKALARFEAYTKFRDFKKYHYEQAIGFRDDLENQTSLQTGQKLSKSTMNTTLRHLKAFFKWLAMQTGFKSRIKSTDANYFNMTTKDTRVANTKREKPVPTLEQIKHVISIMPSATDIEHRDRAIVAFTVLTGARDSAIASFKLKHVDIENQSVFQDARDVKTKFSKTFTTHFFPVGDDIQAIVVDWVGYLRSEKLWGEDDPLFPRTAMALSENQLFEAVGLDRVHWSTANPIRKIFRTAFENAGLHYYNPHTFRNTLARLGGTLCKTAEQYKAWSQNLGHSQVLTTFTSYGEVQVDRQGEIIRNLLSQPTPKLPNTEELADAIVRRMREAD